MDITQIENLISQAATLKGYSAVIASEQALEASIEALPTAWIQLPVVLYVEGREQGIIGHKVVVTLLDDCKGLSFEDQRERLATLQSNIFEIMSSVSQAEGVVELSDMTVTPKCQATTAHDNIAQVCQATIVSYF